MYPVSTDFINAMRADKRRVEARVTIDYTDWQIDQSIGVSASEQANVSYPAQTADGVSAPTYKWASLDGAWTLDGSFHLAPEPEDLTQYQFGWWSAQVADATGAFASPYPSLTVTHIARPIHSLRVAGDSARGEYPVDFTIQLYDASNTLVYSQSVTGNTAVDWSMTLPSPVLDVAKQVLTITKWSHPGRQAKILEFFTSIQETYESGDVVEIKLLEEREASQGSLPVGNISANEISVRLANEGRKFDVTNQNSPLAGLLKPNRRIRAWLGIRGDGDGQNVTAQEQTQADFQQGTLSGVQATAAGDLELGPEPYGDISTGKESGATASSQYSSSYSPDNAVDGSIVFGPDTAYASANGAPLPQWIQVDLGALYWIDKFEWINNRAAARLPGDYTVAISPTGQFSGEEVVVATVTGNTTYTWVTHQFAPTKGRYVRMTVTAIYNGSYYELAEIRVYGWKYPVSGSRTSPILDLSPVGIAASSSISWTATTPAGTAVQVETSLDGGATWQAATNGGPIPGITPGMDLTGKSLLVRQTLTTTDTTQTPQLHDLTVAVYHEEWVPLGVYWSLDWDSPDDEPVATATGRDRLELLRKSTYVPTQVQQGVSLYALAEQVLQDAGLQPSDYVIDPDLQSIVVPWAWLSPTSHREALRIIAEAALAVVYADRDGVVRVEAMGSVPDTPVAEITADDYFPPLQAPSRQDQVANEIVVTTQPLRPADTPQEVYKSTTPIAVPAGQAVTVQAKYNQPPVIEATASLDNPPAGVSITAATYYAWGAEVTINNTGASAADVTLVVTGKPLSVQGGEQVVARDQTSITENGVLRYEFPANPLVQTLQQAQAIAQALLASAKDPRRDIEVEWRGNPALALGDRVAVVGQNVHVIRQELNWSGALSARLTGRKVT